MVDEAHQIIVATDVEAQASDQGQLLPLLDEVSESFGVEPEVVLADAGYCNEADLAALEQRGIDGHVALGREGKAGVAVDSQRRPATHRMGEKLASAKGRAQYAKRKWISEGPNGWIKEVLDLVRPYEVLFSRRPHELNLSTGLAPYLKLIGAYRSSCK